MKWPIVALCALAVALAALAALAAPAAAQGRLAVLSEPGTPVIATEVLVAAGPADEEAEGAGLAYLAARAVTAPILPVLDSLGAHLAVDAHKDALAFSLTAAPDAWQEAVRVLLVALFRDPPDSTATVRQRRAIRAELAGREPNPADAVLREADAAFFGPDHPWGRAAVGSIASVDGLSVRQVDRFLRANFRPERTVVAVVGPIERAQVREQLQPYLGGEAADLPAPEAPAPSDTLVRRDYNSITTWISASYAFPPTADVEAIRLLARLTGDALSFGPRRHSVYNVRAEVLPRLGGGQLRFQLVVPPEEAEAWAERIGEAVSRIAGTGLAPAVFQASLRRYRGERLLGLAAPEDRAREAARHLLLTGDASAPLPDLERLSPERLRAAARSLGTPIVVFLGPNLDDAEPTKGTR